MTARGDRRVVLILGLAAAAFAGVAVAATGGPVPVATETSGGWVVGPLERTAGRRTDAVDEAPGREQVESAAADVAATLVQIAAVIAVAVVLFLLGRIAWRVLTAAAPGDAPPVETVELAAPSGPPPELAEAVEEGLASLADGPVDDVIIACWVRLEEAAAAGGVARSPSETSAELAVRVLARFDVPAEPVERLLSRYRAARYSRHRLGEDDRAAAIAALHEIGAAMAVRA
jgi:hypothetical protein